MDAPESSSLTDSPWFWVMMFSLMALGALVAIGGKYGRRQANIERQYQARTRVAEQQTDEYATPSPLRGTAGEGPIAAGESKFATPGNTLVPLWPLAAVLILVALFAACMLIRSRGRGRPGSLVDSHPSP